MPSCRANSARLPLWACTAARSISRSASASGRARVVCSALGGGSAEGPSEPRRAPRRSTDSQCTIDSAALDGAPIAQQRRALQHVAQFAHVAGEAMALQPRQGLGDRAQPALAAPPAPAGPRPAAGCRRCARAVPAAGSGRCSAGSTGPRGSGRRPPSPTGRGAWPPPRAHRFGAVRCCPRAGRCRFPAAAAA